MLSKPIRKIIMTTSIAIVTATSLVFSSPMMKSISVEAAAINTQAGKVTVLADSLWAYGSASWSDKNKTYTKGTALTVTEKHNVDGGEMYKLSNGLFISAHPKYVSFKASASSPTPTPETAEIMLTTENLNLRKGAGVNQGVILTIPKGKQVKVISLSGEWVQVDYQGNRGYVLAKYLKGSSPIPTEPKPEIPSGERIMKETTENLNLRSGAGANYSKLLTIAKGEKVIVLSTSGEWAKIDYQGKVGYVSSLYLKIVENDPIKPSPPVVETPLIKEERKTTENLNLRSGAGTNYAKLLTIPKGEKVTVLDESGGWAKIDYQGKVGYVTSTYLVVMETTPIKPDPPVDESPVLDEERKTTENLNMRTGAGTQNQIVLTIPKGTRVTLLSENGEWAKIRYLDKIGYVSALYLEKVEITPPVIEPAPTPEEPVITKDLRIVTGNLYLRSEAHGESSILRILNKGTIVEVESLTGKWAKITHEGTTGYASSEYMSSYDGEAIEIPTEEPTESEEDLRETLYNLNMRKGPGTDQSIVLTIPKGTILLLIEVEGLWGKVNYQGQAGYVSMDYLTKVSDSHGPEDSELQGKLDHVDQVNYTNEDILVSGWAKMESGVKEVKVYLNSKVQGTAKYGILRPGDENPNTGFTYMIKRNNLFPGVNKILVVITGNQGERVTYTRTIKVNKVPVIVIDAGHGGKDSGASGILNGTKVYEKTYVLQFASALNDALSSSGFQTIMTRNKDQFIELNDRAKIGNNNHADLFFSLHHDYNDSTSTKGAFVIYPSYKTKSISASIVEESMDVANHVKQSLTDLGFNNRKNGSDKNLSGNTLAVLRETETRSILAELGYLSNAEDLSKISDPVFQKAMAQNLTKQLKAYFKMN